MIYYSKTAWISNLLCDRSIEDVLQRAKEMFSMPGRPLTVVQQTFEVFELVKVRLRMKAAYEGAVGQHKAAVF